MKLKSYLMLMLHFESLFSLIEEYAEVREVHKSQASCTYAIASRYFVNGTVIYSVSVDPNITDATSTVDLNKRILEKLHSRLQWTVSTKYSVTNHSGWIEHLNRATGYILLVNTIDDLLENVLYLKDLPTWNPNAPFIILFVETASFVSELTSMAMSTLWEYNIINALILIPSEMNKTIFKIVTWFPYANGSCGDTLSDFSYLDTCNNGKFHRKINLYPSKVPDNINGCQFQVITVVWPPFIIHPKDFEIDDNTEVPLTNGYEILLMKVLEQRYNCKFIYRSFSEPENWGDVYPNKTFTGLFQYLMEGRADIGIGAIFPKSVLHDEFDYSIQYFQDQYALVLPLAGLAPGWQNFITILNPAILTTCFFTFIITSIFFFLTAKGRSEPKIYKTKVGATIAVLSIALINCIGIQPKYFRLRVVFISWSFFNIVMNAVFQSGLIRTYRYPMVMYQIREENEIIDKGYIMAGTDSVKHIYGDSEDFNSRYIIKHYQELKSLQSLQYVAYYKNITSLTSRSYLSYIPNELRKRIFVPKHNVISIPIEMLFVKGFPFQNNFNKVIAMCLSSGLFEKWKSHVRNTMQTNSTEENSGDVHMKSEIYISLSDISGAFAFLFLGYLLSVVSFLCEIKQLIKIMINNLINKFARRHQTRKRKNSRFSFVL